MAVLPEDKSAPCGSDEPQQHVGQQHPDRVLHPRDTSIAFSVLGDVHLAEDTERDQVADEDEEVDEEEEPRLQEEWDHSEQGHYGAQSAAHDSPDPFRVGV